MGPGNDAWGGGKGIGERENRSDRADATYWAKGIRQRVASVFWAMRGLRGLGRLLFPILQAGLGHLLADAAFLDEVLLQSAALLVEEVIRLMDEADGDVRQDLGRTGVHERAVGLVALVGGAAEFADVEGFLAVFVPEGVVADSEVVLVIEEELLQAGAGDVDELELHLGGGDGGFAAFTDVLFPGAGGLHHLVDGALAFLEEAVAEAEGEVEDGLGFAEGEEFPVVAALGKETGWVVFWGRLGHGGSFFE